jgi:hypothetical protein
MPYNVRLATPAERRTSQSCTILQRVQGGSSGDARRELMGDLFSRPFRSALQFLNGARRAQEGAAAPFFLAAFSSFFLALSSAFAP